MTPEGPLLTSAIKDSTPIKAVAKALGVDPRSTQRMFTFDQVNEGPASIAARITSVKDSMAKDDSPYVTSLFGQPVPTVTHSLQIGGYPVSSDVHLFKKQQTFNWVHPSGLGAFGYFETTINLAGELSKAMFLQGMGKKTPVFTCFSTVTVGREFPDSCRNPRGFAVKFYTKEGNYDLVRLNWPVFFVRDPMQGPDIICSQQRNPWNFLIDYDSWYDFLANVPKSMHAGTMLMLDHGTPVGWRFMDEFGCHTFKWVNTSGVQTFVKYHWLSEQPKKQFVWDEAVRMCGEDPDFAKRDLYDHIASGGTVSWKLCIQTMTVKEVQEVAFDPFDVTREPGELPQGG
ncbi:hypothetical protein HDU88_002377 [Geranomyces variabilis]|nr:hypothetical protein HDU88_002377 [Geranomyces variabilis]